MPIATPTGVTCVQVIVSSDGGEGGGRAPTLKCGLKRAVRSRPKGFPF